MGVVGFKSSEGAMPYCQGWGFSQKEKREEKRGVGLTKKLGVLELGVFCSIAWLVPGCVAG